MQGQRQYVSLRSFLLLNGLTSAGGLQAAGLQAEQIPSIHSSQLRLQWLPDHVGNFMFSVSEKMF